MEILIMMEFGEIKRRLDEVCEIFSKYPEGPITKIIVYSN